MKNQSPSSCLGLSPNQKLSKPLPRIGLVCIPNTAVQSSVLPDNLEPLPKLSDICPEIPNLSSATVTRTNAANSYVPIKFLFALRMPTNTITTALQIRHLNDVEL